MAKPRAQTDVIGQFAIFGIQLAKFCKHTTQQFKKQHKYKYNKDANK